MSKRHHAKTLSGGWPFAGPAAGMQPVEALHDE